MHGRFQLQATARCQIREVEGCDWPADARGLKRRGVHLSPLSALVHISVVKANLGILSNVIFLFNSSPYVIAGQLQP